MPKQALAAPLFGPTNETPPAQGGDIASQPNDSSPHAGGASIPEPVVLPLTVCETPEMALAIIGHLLPVLGVSPTRRIQALMLLNPSFDRPSYPGLANRVGRCKPYVHNVCTQKLDSDPLQIDVAAALGVCVADIWPPDSHTPTVEQS